jgi:hypothetical protein
MTDTWQPLAPAAWLLPYGNKAAGTANCVAFDMGGGRLAVVSPSQGTSNAAFAAIDALGTVDALIAPGGHDLGQPEWQARYPNARTFAPAKTIGALAKKKSLRAFQPLSELSADPSSGLRFLDAPGSKVGSAFVQSKEVRYIDELLGNQSSLPPSFMFSLLFRLTGSAPGLRVNRVYTSMLTADKKALARAALDTIDGASCIVLAHGDVLRGAQIEEARALLRGLA